MTNRLDYSRMKKGESKACLAAVARRRDTDGRTGAKMAARAGALAAAARAEKQAAGGGKKK